MKNNKKINYLLLNLIAMGLFLICAVVYLFEVNTNVSYGLEIREYNSKLKDLKIKNEELFKQVAKLNSMDNLYEISNNLNMVKIAHFDYVIPVNEKFAGK